MTDDEVLLDGGSVIDVFSVNSARRERVEVSERKFTKSDRKLFRKAKELELQSWLDHGVVSTVSSVCLQSALCLCCPFSVSVGSSCPVSGKAHIGYKVLSHHVSVWSLIS